MKTETTTVVAPVVAPTIAPKPLSADVRQGPGMRAPSPLASKPLASSTVAGEITKTVSAKPAKAKAAKAKPASKAKAKAESKTRKAGLYFFQMTPMGGILRAYFLAFIMHQTGGKLAVGKVFRLWPAANIRGHLETRKVERAEGGYKLTAAGYNYFTDPLQMADKDMLAQMSRAVRSGEKPACYPRALDPVKAD